MPDPSLSSHLLSNMCSCCPWLPRLHLDSCASPGHIPRGLDRTCHQQPIENLNAFEGLIKSMCIKPHQSSLVMSSSCRKTSPRSLQDNPKVPIIVAKPALTVRCWQIRRAGNKVCSSQAVALSLASLQGSLGMMRKLHSPGISHRHVQGSVLTCIALDMHAGDFHVIIGDFKGDVQVAHSGRALHTP